MKTTYVQQEFHFLNFISKTANVDMCNFHVVSTICCPGHFTALRSCQGFLLEGFFKHFLTVITQRPIFLAIAFGVLHLAIPL